MNRFLVPLMLLTVDCAQGQDVDVAHRENPPSVSTLTVTAPQTTGIHEEQNPTTGYPYPNVPDEDSTTIEVGVKRDLPASEETPVPSTCGDGKIQAPETCDGRSVGRNTCQSLGFDTGKVLCTASCTLDLSQCKYACGNNVVEGTEECDCGEKGFSCNSQTLQGKTCQSLVSPSRKPYGGGALLCWPQDCKFNTELCYYCGDGVRNGNEECDKSDLSSQTCLSKGFQGGNLSCSPSCTLDFSQCSDPQKTKFCGDKVCDRGENSCNCEADCLDDPNSCSSCECGFFGGSCNCDTQCEIFADCCTNMKEVCKP